MSQVSTFLIKSSLIIIGIYILQSCTNHQSQPCNVQIENKLIENNFLVQDKPFILEKKSNEWIALREGNEQIVESRYAYKVEIDPNSELLLINHRQLKSNEISDVLEKEFSELIKKFEKENIDNIPNVGFQFIYANSQDKINAKKIAKIVCLLVESVEEVKREYKEKPEFEQDKINKLLQLRFSFFNVL